MEEAKIIAVAERYCKNEMEELKKIVHHIVRKYDNPSDYTEYYSLALEVLYKAAKNFDDTKNINFGSFLYGCYDRKVKTYLRDKTKAKRCNKKETIGDDGNKITEIIGDVSLNALQSDDSSQKRELEEAIPDSSADIELSGYSEKMEKYLSSLNSTQRKILHMLADGYRAEDIQLKLGLDKSLYQQELSAARMYGKVKVFYGSSTSKNIATKNNIGKRKRKIMSFNGSMERSKNTQYSIKALIKRIKKHDLRDDHPLQRYSDQHDSLTKSEYISDIAQGRSMLPIIISEEVIGDVVKRWIIDGKQRCGTIISYLNDGFKINKNIQTEEIQYLATEVDENGNAICDDYGEEVTVVKTFDIRNKKFSQLPSEMQENILDYSMPILLNINCSKEDIAYDIARFNRCRPMNVAQNGWTGINENYAEVIDKILKLPFFKENSMSFYRSTATKNGATRRMIVESIMTSYFINDFCRDFKKGCTYLNDNANDKIFTDFYCLIERLQEVPHENVADMFNIKDSFLWFAVFSRFIEIQKEYPELIDADFIRFMEAFKNELHEKEVDGTSWDDIIQNRRNTKDKSLVILKIKTLVLLMVDFLGVKYDFDSELDSEEQTEIEKTEEVAPEESPEDAKKLADFLKENVNPEICEDDVDFYKESFEDYTVEVNNDSKLLERENRFSMIGIIAYSFEKDVDPTEWIVQFFDKNNDYNPDQKENYKYMKKDFEEFVGYKHMNNDAKELFGADEIID